MKLFAAIFPDSCETLIARTPRRLWYKAYSLLRYNARYDTPEAFTHADFPELEITASRFTIPEDRSEDGKLHTTTVIERTVF